MHDAFKKHYTMKFGNANPDIAEGAYEWLSGGLNEVIILLTI